MLTESSDQSGTVGFLVGIIVLVFAGICFSMMVDKRFKFATGKADLEAAILDEGHQLEDLRRQEKTARDELEQRGRLKDQPAELEKAKQAASSTTEQLKELRAQQASLAEAVKAEKSEFAAYRTTYRKQLRQAAAGEKLPELQVMSGKVYRDVTIRRVTATGMEVSHAQGSSSIAADDLADSWRERFQWNAEEIAAALEEEKANEPKPDARPVPVKQQKPEKGFSPAKQAQQDAEKKFASLRRDMAEAKRRLDRAETEVSRARNEALTNKGKTVPGSLETWPERITRLEAASEAFRAQYVDARGKLTAASPDDAALRDNAPE
ncbi:hypothetical protein [Luteolibacter soli]|uniref:Uncharacterized protein n=1 Tax=Luteolibacter soli TaxID=3135280 RepID=A0ABU9AXX4_9BACT